MHIFGITMHIKYRVESIEIDLLNSCHKDTALQCDFTKSQIDCIPVYRMSTFLLSVKLMQISIAIEKRWSFKSSSVFFFSSHTQIGRRRKRNRNRKKIIKSKRRDYNLKNICLKLQSNLTLVYT